MFKLIYTKENILKGVVLYSVFDAISAIILGEFSFQRLLGMMFLGGTFYAFEIPSYFAWIEKKSEQYPIKRRPFVKTLYALAYFNPLWIARHLIVIDLLTFGTINPDILTISYKSFLFNIPISFLGNFIIQNLITLQFRYVASAVFSGLMAIYYAFAKVLFG